MTGIAFALLGFFSMFGFILGVVMERGSARRGRVHWKDECLRLRKEITDLRWQIKYFQRREQLGFLADEPEEDPEYIIQEAV